MTLLRSAIGAVWTFSSIVARQSRQGRAPALRREAAVLRRPTSVRTRTTTRQGLQMSDRRLQGARARRLLRLAAFELLLCRSAPRSPGATTQPGFQGLARARRHSGRDGSRFSRRCSSTESPRRGDAGPCPLSNVDYTKEVAAEWRAAKKYSAGRASTTIGQRRLPLQEGGGRTSLLVNGTRH